MLTVYTKNDCPYCIMAKGLLESQNVEFEMVNIEHDTEAREKIVNAGLRSVPQIYYKEELFVQGGYQGLKELGPQGIQQRLTECAGDA